MMDFFVQGLLHPLAMPAHLITLIAVGLLAGQQGFSHVRATLVAVLITLAGSSAFTLVNRISWDYFETGLLIMAAVCGMLVLLRLKLSVWLVVIAGVFAAVLVGLDSAAPRIPGLRGNKVYALLTGTVLSAATLTMLCSLIALLFRNVFGGIALRVLGAWITAGACLVLALFLSKTISL